MKTLFVLRHAKSDWGDESLRDFDRPLNHRGRKAAKAVGRELKDRDIHPDFVICSPAVRAKQTLECLLEGYGQQLSVTEDRRIYLAEPDLLADLIRSAPDEAKRLMIVGHNPGLQELVIALATPGELLDEAAEKFPTAALAEIRFDIESWRDVAPGDGSLEALLKAREL